MANRNANQVLKKTADKNERATASGKSRNELS